MRRTARGPPLRMAGHKERSTAERAEHAEEEIRRFARSADH
jgi:hypothetical protein